MTEQNYVDNLKIFVKQYKIPLREHGILSQSEIDIMFSNIDDIINVNSHFLK